MAQPPDLPRLDRRTTLKWVFGAAASVKLLALPAAGTPAASPPAATPGSPGAASPAAPAVPYGPDPDLMRVYRPGELWPLTLSAAERRTAAALCDLIIPADELSPSASAVGVVDFLDEWLSAPYEAQQRDRAQILAGLANLEKASLRRFNLGFADLGNAQQRELCDPICYLPKAADADREAALFFARYRDLTAGGFYTTPAGTRDLGFVGNVALARFDGPPPAVLKQAGLA